MKYNIIFLLWLWFKLCLFLLSDIPIYFILDPEFTSDKLSKFLERCQTNFLFDWPVFFLISYLNIIYISSDFFKPEILFSSVVISI